MNEKKDIKDIIIYGSGGLGRGIIDLINSINKKDNTWNIKGFVDDNYRKHTTINGIDILGDHYYLFNYKDEVNVVLAFGNPHIKNKIYNQLKQNRFIKFPSLIHPSVEVSSYNKLGKGNIISKGVSLSTNIEIMDFNIIHFNCSIGHDVHMGSFNSIFPLSAISGYVKMGDCVEVGSSATVIPTKTIGSNVRIGAGSVIISDVSDNTTVVGVPAKDITNRK